MFWNFLTLFLLINFCNCQYEPAKEIQPESTALKTNKIIGDANAKKAEENLYGGLTPANTNSGNYFFSTIVLKLEIPPTNITAASPIEEKSDNSLPQVSNNSQVLTYENGPVNSENTLSNNNQVQHQPYQNTTVEGTVTASSNNSVNGNAANYESPKQESPIKSANINEIANPSVNDTNTGAQNDDTTFIPQSAETTTAIQNPQIPNIQPNNSIVEDNASNTLYNVDEIPKESAPLNNTNIVNENNGTEPIEILTTVGYQDKNLETNSFTPPETYESVNILNKIPEVKKDKNIIGSEAQKVPENKTSEVKTNSETYLSENNSEQKIPEKENITEQKNEENKSESKVLENTQTEELEKTSSNKKPENVIDSKSQDYETNNLETTNNQTNLEIPKITVNDKEISKPTGSEYGNNPETKIPEGAKQVGTIVSENKLITESKSSEYEPQNAELKSSDNFTQEIILTTQSTVNNNVNENPDNKTLEVAPNKVDESTVAFVQEVVLTSTAIQTENSTTLLPKIKWEIAQENATIPNVETTKQKNQMNETGNILEASKVFLGNNHVVQSSGYDTAVEQNDLVLENNDNNDGIGKLPIKHIDSSTKRKWEPFQMDCKTEVDERGSELCSEWANGVNHRATMFLFCRKTCLCVGPQTKGNLANEDERSMIDDQTARRKLRIRRFERLRQHA